MIKHTYKPLYKIISHYIAVVKHAEPYTRLSGTFAHSYQEGEEELIKIAEFLPSGSGFDSGSSIDIEKSSKNKIIIKSGFHPLNGNGYYEPWIDFTVTVTPDFKWLYDLKIKGNFGKNQDLKEYILEEFTSCLDIEYNHKLEVKNENP